MHENPREIMENQVKVLQRGKRKIRKGQVGGPWIFLRKTVQYLALFLFITLFVWSRQDGGQANIINIPMRMDPLLILAHLVASRTFLSGSALALIVILLTIVFGRAWCGWLCPLGTIIDLFPLNHWRKNRPAPSDGWRRVKFDFVIVIPCSRPFGKFNPAVLRPVDHHAANPYCQHMASVGPDRDRC
jgi:hypothetical protein